MMNEKKILDKLTKTISNDPKNVDEILKLSHNLATLDKDNIRFSVDSSVIDRLGRELVARHETAVSELIKNAYDADASFVSLKFSNVDNTGGTLIVNDDGSGMTREQLINGFMRISSTSKIHEPKSPIYKRSRAGKKGIGRFSAQRLGKRLTILTQTKDSDTTLKVVIDWNKYSMDEDLFSISNTIVEIPKEFEQGTKLIIEDLREWWSEHMIKRVYRYAIDIVQPFPLSKVKKTNKGKVIDPGFDISCYRNDVAIADPQTMFYQHALAEIEGYVDEKGNAYWTINDNKVGLNIPKPIKIEDSENLFTHLNNVRFKAYYFIHSLTSNQVRSYIREAAEESGGIRIYKNGFRVLPYGETKNDWLGLDASIRRRTILPVHGNSNFFGFVEINDLDKKFVELSSREGLFNDTPYLELVDFVYKSLIAAVSRIASERGKKTTTGEKGWDAKYAKTPKESILDTADDLDELADKIESGQIEGAKKTDDDSKEEEKKAEADGFRQKAQILRDSITSIDELNMIRVLAGLGLIIGEFTHEIMNYLSGFDIDTKFILDIVEKGTKEYKSANRLRKTFKSFNVYASYFDETISQNVNQELRIIELRDVIKPFVKNIRPDVERNNINIDTNINGYDLFTCKMHTSEWASILFNLYSNSKKAIKKVKPIKGKILITAGKEDNYLFVEFIDNGIGIPTENIDKIFNAFFTTSSPKGHKATSTDELTGTGLGLKIVKDIVESYNGEISIENAPVGFTTNIKIRIPIATKEDIKKYAF